MKKVTLIARNEHATSVCDLAKVEFGFTRRLTCCYNKDSICNDSCAFFDIRDVLSEDFGGGKDEHMLCEIVVCGNTPIGQLFEEGQDRDK